MEIDENESKKIREVKIEYYEQYFGKRKDYYIPKLIAFENGTKYSFNLGPFLLGIFWVLYRRLYIHSVIIILAVIVESKIENVLLKRFGDTKDLEITLRLIWLFIIAIILGFLGNYFFLKHSIRKVEKTISSTADENEKLLKLKKSGSGNWILVISIVSIFVLALIFGQK